jgi:hypothetical protein
MAAKLLLHLGVFDESLMMYQKYPAAADDMTILFACELNIPLSCPPRLLQLAPILEVLPF